MKPEAAASASGSGSNPHAASVLSGTEHGRNPLSGTLGFRSVPLFRLRGIEVRYSSKAQGDPDFACASLELASCPTVFLVGPNGSGKSTFLKLLDGLVKPSAGSLDYLGPVPAQGRRSAYLHQHPYLLAGTVGYNAAYACMAAGLPAQEARHRAAEALSSLGLAGFEPRRHRRLSGGEAQRVALARIIASGAPVLLLDEPTASADAESARLIGLTLAALSASGRSLVISTHDPSFIDDFSAGNAPESAQSGAFRVLSFSRGRIVADSIHDGNCPDLGGTDADPVLSRTSPGRAKS